MNVKNSKAIGTITVAIVVVIVVVVAAIGAYFAVTSSVSTTSTTSSGPTSTTPTTSSVQTTTKPCITSTSVASNNTIQTDVIPLLQAVKNMTASYSYPFNGTTRTIIDSYQVVSTSASGALTTYNVNLTSAGEGYTSAYASWVQSNGNVLAAESTNDWGENITGQAAQAVFLSVMTPFVTESTIGATAQLYTGSVSNGTLTQTYGPTTMQITSYSITSLPQTYNSCGVSQTVTAFAMYRGQVPSTTLSLITFLHFEGTSNGQSEDFTVRVLSIIAA